MSLMGFQKKKYLDRGVGGWVGGWVELYPIYFWKFVNYAKPLKSVPYRLC